MGKTKKVHTEEKQKDFCHHLRSVGCKDVAHYQEWCIQNGLKTSLKKSIIELRQETELYNRMQGQAALVAARRFTRHPETVLIALSEGQTADLRIYLRGDLALLNNLFYATRKEHRVRAAFLRLLLTTVRQPDFYAPDSVTHRGYGMENTLAGGLLALARRYKEWKRQPEEWKPVSHSARRQFSELARHLLCEYDVPEFLESAWFRGNDQAVRLHQSWFIQVGNGVSLRSLFLPLRLTKRMAHIALMGVPGNCSVEEGWRWAQIIGMGGSERLARAILGIPLGTSFRDEDFWETVVRFLVDNPLLDVSRVGPLVDYLWYEKYTPRRMGDRNRLPENFTMKGRTMAALLSRVDEWHRHQAQAARVTTDRWEPSGYKEYRFVEERLTGDTVWTIQEITTGKGLVSEGRDMSHCVASYAYSCARGSISIWSLKALHANELEPQRVMTIAVTKDGVVSEVRGRRNALPGQKQDFYGVRLNAKEIDLLTRGCRVFHQWTKEAGLREPHYLRL